MSSVASHRAVMPVDSVSSQIPAGSAVTVDLHYDSPVPLTNPVFGMRVASANGVRLFHLQTLSQYAEGALVGTPDRILDTAGRFEEHGVEEIIISAASLPFAVFDPSMLELFSETVIARAAG